MEKGVRKAKIRTDPAKKMEKKRDRDTALENAGVIRFAPSRVCQIQRMRGESSQPTGCCGAGSAECSLEPGSTASFAQGYFAKPSTSSTVAAGGCTVIHPAEVTSLRTPMNYSPFTTFFTEGEGIPPSFNRYWDLTRARNLAVQKAVEAVRFAYESAYGDQIEECSHLMVAALRDGLVPHHPQATPARMVELTGKTMEEDLHRLVRFASLLPGFNDLDERDQKSLLPAKHLISGLLHRAKFIHRGEMYTYAPGPDRVHTGAYYMRAIELDAQFIRLFFGLADRVKDVGLAEPETYMLLAVAILAPDSAIVSDKDILGVLHAYYLDVLFYMLGSRLSIADRALAYHKLEKIMQQFPILDKISLSYVRDLDFSRAPLRPRSITFVDSLRK